MYSFTPFSSSSTFSDSSPVEWETGVGVGRTGAAGVAREPNTPAQDDGDVSAVMSCNQEMLLDGEGDTIEVDFGVKVADLKGDALPPEYDAKPFG